MHAIVESLPGNEPALYLLGKEQEVQETTETLGNLLQGAQTDAFSEYDGIRIGETFNALTMDPFRDPRMLSDRAAALALGVLPQDIRVDCEEAFIASVIDRLDTGQITEAYADAKLTRFSETSRDFIVLNFDGVESEVKLGQTEPYQRPIIWEAQPERREVMETGLGLVMPRLPAQSATFENPKEREIAQSLKAVAASKQFEIDWNAAGTPTLASEREHKLLWVKERHDLAPAVTILSPDHPARQPKQ